MKRIFGLICALVLLIASTLPLSAKEATERVIVKYRPNTVHAQVGRMVYNYKHLDAAAIDILPVEMAKLRQDPNVLFIEKDGEVHITSELSNSWGAEMIGALAVHGNTTGSGVKVAILDTGIDYNHPELQSVYAGGWDFVNNDADPMDDHGHGTHCSGIIAAQEDGAGLIGVAPNVHLYALKVLNSQGSGTYSEIIAALDWCIEQGVDITSNSYGGAGYSSILDEAFATAWGAGIVSVAAAGNLGGDGTMDLTLYPARLESVIAVGAVDINKIKAMFTSAGPAIEVCAPGVNIYSSVIGGYDTWSGTSMACPFVAGTAALVASAHPDWSNEQIRGQLRASADDLGTPGHDWIYGFGLVDADEAVGNIISNPPPMPPLPPPSLPPVMPVLATLPATNITAHSAVLNGELYSMGSFTSLSANFFCGPIEEWGIYGWGAVPPVMYEPGYAYLVRTGLTANHTYRFHFSVYDKLIGFKGGYTMYFTTLPEDTQPPEPTPTPTPTPPPPPPEPTTIIISSFKFTLSAQNKIGIEAKAANDAGQSVSGVNSTFTVTSPDGSKKTVSGVSDTYGIISSNIRGNALPGLWLGEIISAGGSGYDWDKGNSVTSANITVTPRKK